MNNSNTYYKAQTYQLAQCVSYGCCGALINDSPTSKAVSQQLCVFCRPYVHGTKQRGLVAFVYLRPTDHPLGRNECEKINRIRPQEDNAWPFDRQWAEEPEKDVQNRFLFQTESKRRRSSLQNSTLKIGPVSMHIFLSRCRLQQSVPEHFYRFSRICMLRVHHQNRQNCNVNQF